MKIMKNYVISYRVIKYEIELDKSILEEYKYSWINWIYLYRYMTKLKIYRLTSKSIK